MASAESECIHDHIAAGQDAYIRVDAFDNVVEKLRSPDNNVAIVTGTSGVGKTELSLQITKEFGRLPADGPILEGRFDCSTTEKLISSLIRFKEDNNLQIPSLNNRTVDDLEKTFQELFAEINQHFPHRLKCFIFDDAERKTEVIRRIDHHICSALDGNEHRDTWKILVTAPEECNGDWFDYCEVLKPDDMVRIDGFTRPQMEEFLAPLEQKGLQADDVELIEQRVGNLPVMLKVVRSELKRRRLLSTRKVLTMCIQNLIETDIVDGENKTLLGLYNSLCRLLNQSNRKEEYKEMMMLLSFYDEKNITTEMLISCAETILGPERFEGVEASKAAYAAYELANGFVDELTNRCLCDEPGGNGLVTLHKLVKQSMKRFMKPLSLSDKLNVARKALLAFSRVMPKDGRGLEPHQYFRNMYDHGLALMHELDVLGESINRTDTPVIMLLMCDLRSSMAYCQITLRRPRREAIEQLDSAFDIYSTLITGENYEHNGDSGDQLSADEQRARVLYEKGRNAQLIYNPRYFDVIKNVSRYHQVTPKDLKNMAHVLDKADEWLFNGHLEETKFVEFKRGAGHVVEPEQLCKFYHVELLAELYSLYSKVYSNEGDTAHLEKCMDCTKAAQLLCSKIRENRDHPFSLMLEVTCQRGFLKLQVQLNRDVNHPRHSTLQDIEQNLEELKQRSGKAYEHGLMRTDFENDDYHKFLCGEALLTCKGLRCKNETDGAVREALIEDCKALFKDLVDETIENRPPHNSQTTSKCYRNYAEFLWHCGQKTDTIGAIIDAMWYMNEYLRTKDDRKYPEHQEGCTKFEPLLKGLDTYHRQYIEERDGRLVTLSTHRRGAARLDYLKGFMDAVRDPDAQVGNVNRFAVMSRILDSMENPTPDDVERGEREEDMDTMPVQAAQATDQS